MEPGVLRSAEKAMEHMSHFMEERRDVVVAHERRAIGRRLREVSNHRSQGIVARPRREFIPWKKAPDSGMRILCSYNRRESASVISSRLL